MKYILSTLLLCMFSLFANDKGEVMANPPTIIMETTQGTIEIELKPSIAPKACENMVKLAEKGVYNGVPFHRIIKQFMIQGGDYENKNGTGGQSIWGKDFEDECTPNETFNRPGLLAMANRGPKTNGSQFFITTVETPWLNGKHTIFGEVKKGYDVVQKLESVQTGMSDRPVQEQKIIKMTVKK